MSPAMMDSTVMGSMATPTDSIVAL